MDKQKAIEKLRELHATKRQAEDMVNTSLKTHLREVKEKRSGRRDAVLLAVR